MFSRLNCELFQEWRQMPVSNIIVNTTEGITVLGAGDVQPNVLEQALSHAPLLVAADGGAAHALNLGHKLTAVIGDLDSLESATAAALPPEIVHRISEQETTDFDKCLRSIISPLVLAVGFTGARVDHELAALSTLVKHAERPIVLLGPQDVIFVAPLEFRLSLALGTRVSLFPMGNVSGKSKGLRWPIDGIEFAPDKRIGTSNEASGTDVFMQFSNRNMLVFLPRDFLDQVINIVAPEFSRPSA